MAESTHVLDVDPVKEVKWRLEQNTSPSFNREVVEKLVDEIERLKAKVEELQENSDIAGAEHTALCDAVASQV